MTGSGSPEVIVIGAGIAGLATAAALRKRGVLRIRIFEAEEFPFSQASGRNAAIYRPLEADPILCALAADSRGLLAELQHQARSPLLLPRGLLLLDATDETLTTAAHYAKKQRISQQILRSADQIADATGLFLRHSGPALWSPDAGVLDPHEIGQALLRTLAIGDIPVHYTTAVARLRTNGRGRCDGVVLASGESLSADAVVVTAGSESVRLALSCGTTIPLVPVQRHLAVLDMAPGALPPHAPVVWSLNPEFYFRPEAGGVLVSPCDETPSPSYRPRAELEALSPLAARFAALYPPLSGAKVRRYWACIRTKAVDGRPLIGPDPSIPGLHYMTGLGGFGMSCGLAAADRFAAQFIGEHPLTWETAPARFLLPCRGARFQTMRRAEVPS